MSVQIENIPSESEDAQSDLSPYRIVSYPADYTLQGLHDKWRAKEIVIPPFQRRYVWTITQASRLIESFLLGLPVPGIFFYKERNSQQLLVIDGQQRLRSVFAYFEGSMPDSNLKFALRGVRPGWDGQSYAQLANSEQIRLRDAVLRATIVDQIDPRDDTSMFHIFERLNTGGTTLTPQEIRNCIYQGPFNELLHELNKNEDWRTILGTSQADKRMRDMELILRLVSLSASGSRYFKPMKDFMSRFMRDANRTPDDVASYGKKFKETVGLVVKSLGSKPFHVKRGLNAAVFDSVMVAFYQRRNGIPPDVKQRYAALLANDAFRSYTETSTTDVDTVAKRIALARKVLFI